MVVRAFNVLGLLAVACCAGCAASPWKAGDFNRLLTTPAVAQPTTTPVTTATAAPVVPAPPVNTQPPPTTTQPSPTLPASPAVVNPPANPLPIAAANEPQATSEPLTVGDIQQGKQQANHLKPLPADRIAPRAKETPQPPPANDEALRGFTQAQLATLQTMLQQLKSGKGLSQTDIFMAAANQPLAVDPLPSVPVAPTLKAARRESPKRPKLETPPKVEVPAETEDEAADEDDPIERVEELRRELIEALEQTIHLRRNELSREARVRYEQELRLSYLSADRLDEASQKIEALPEAAAESYRHLLFALSQLTPKEDDKKPAHRHARVLKALRDAAQELSAASRLELRNMAFCEAVEQFGWYTEFKRREFAPGQQVLLYVEVENVTSERKGPQQFETELHGRYQIFDTAGKLMAERTLPVDKENCRNWRRDYFLTYRVYLPETIPPGNYRLELELEDLKGKTTNGGKKMGEGLLEFVVK